MFFVGMPVKQVVDYVVEIQPPQQSDQHTQKPVLALEARIPDVPKQAVACDPVQPLATVLPFQHTCLFG